MTSFDGLPGELRVIAEVAGLEAALQLAHAYGGTQVYLPRQAGPDHWLVTCVGQEAADKICAHYCVRDAEGRAIGRLRMVIPRGPAGLMRQAKRRLAEELRSGKVSVAEAARRAGLVERTGWRMKAKLRDGGSGEQGELF